MGTNYYVAENRCECCKRFDRDIHIGKKSYGWAFSFHGFKEWPANLTTWQKWKEYLKDKEIVDEYGDIIHFDDFVELIEKYGSPGFVREDGHKNRVHNVEGKKDGYFSPEYDWDDPEGYSFSAREFS